MASSSLLAVGIVASAWILSAQKLVQPNPSLRRRVTSLLWWKAQFSLHPVLIGLGVFYIGGSRWYSDNGSQTALLRMLALSPFVFNWGVEPYDMPDDKIFRMLFYLHHIAPLCTVVVTGDGHDPTRGDDISFAAAQALVFGHLWCLHTFFTLERYEILSKQSLFLPYHVQGMVVFFVYWVALFRLVGDATTATDGVDDTFFFWTSMTLKLSMPLLLQLLGRWGLYLRLLRVDPDGPAKDDQFERRKQPVELALLVGMAGAAKLFLGRNA